MDEPKIHIYLDNGNSDQPFSNESNYCVYSFTGQNLGLQVLGYSVLWAGISGMRWDKLVPIVHSMTNCFGIPKMVLIHCGGNDIGIDPCGKLLFHLKFAVYVISKMLPGSMIVYSNILPRRTWRYSYNTDAMERTRKRLNRGLRTYLLQNNSYAIAHPDFAIHFHFQI
jgi:hypothetical protein